MISETGSHAVSAFTDSICNSNCNLFRNFGWTWVHFALTLHSSLCPARLLQCFAVGVPDRLHSHGHYCARFAHRLKKCCGGDRFSLRPCFWNFVARSLRKLQLLLLLLLPLAALHSFSARSGSPNLRCLNCVLVSHVCSGVIRSLPVRVLGHVPCVRGRCIVVATRQKIKKNLLDALILRGCMQFAACLMNRSDVGSDGKTCVRRGTWAKKSLFLFKLRHVPARPARVGTWDPRLHPSKFVVMANARAESCCEPSLWWQSMPELRLPRNHLSRNVGTRNRI